MRVETLKLGPMDNNTYWLIDDATGDCAVVDPGFEDPALLARAEQAGAALRYVLLTHRHFDHIMAARRLRELTGAKICIHPKDACGLSHQAFSLSCVPHGPLTPDHTFVDNDVVRLGESAIGVLHTPGHTLGSVCFVCDPFLFTGDTLFRLGMGRTDLPTGNEEQMKASLKRLAALSGDYMVLPGHGKSSTLDVERAMNPFMIEAQTT